MILETIKNSKMEIAPPLFQEFSSEHGGEAVYFIDDQAVERSYRHGLTIYVNVRAEYWRNYIQFGVESWEEAIVMKFLHEAGHIYCGHSGTLDEKGDGTSLSRGASKEYQDKCEREAWQAAIAWKQSRSFEDLVCAFKDWVSTHHYKNRTW
ncbi:hypothetical protein [Marinobacterium aestuariivivens]|uniref:IrrE N-terminal-like domain-containing protein n=1 Tax=Marinobacterium aestuariivivens TaxID=1698799 RepID=A0ABW2A9B8_9GAMM